MRITENLEIKDLCLYSPKEKALIVADFHMGFEEYLNKQGVLVPRFQFKETKERLEKTLNGLDLNKIIINGDLKHEFGTISKTEWSNTLGLLDLLAKHCKEIILLKGNHDTILGPIASKRNIEIKESYELGKTFICHGHKIPKIPSKTKTIIIAHEHPAISLREGGRSELYKCFLKGKYKGKELIVMPSFNLVNEGSDITKQKLLSPFLIDLSDFRIWIVSDTVYDFGLVKELP